MDRDQRSREAQYDATEANRYREEATKVARLVLEHRGISEPSEAEVRRCARKPKVVAEAKLRLGSFHECAVDR